jgi:hypothetical protein
VALRAGESLGGDCLEVSNGSKLGGGDELEARGTIEHAVVGHERQTETDGGGSDPAVSVVQLVPEGMPGPGAIGPQLGADEHHLVVWLQHGQLGEAPLELAPAKLSPTSTDSLTWAMAVSEPGLGSSADGKGEEGIDRSFERTATPKYLGE